MKEINKKILVVFLVLVLAVLIYALQQKHSWIENIKDNEEATLPEDLKSALERNVIAEEITSKEYVLVDGRRLLRINGTRKSIIGMSEYTEKISVWVNESSGFIERTEVVSRTEEGCLLDLDCVTGGPSTEVCALRKVLPKIKFLMNETEPTECHTLSACKCIEGKCRWQRNDLFDECLKKGIKGDIDV
ncbi:MAG: hypothetical protein WAX07_09775 [Candidatus Altiarchaeia archaeon]